MNYNLLYIGDDRKLARELKSYLQGDFNIISSKDIQMSLDIINTTSISCVIAETSKELNIIGFLEKLKLKAPSISRILVVKEEDLPSIDNDIIMSKIDVMFALTEPYEGEYIKQAVTTACMANGNDKRALFFSVSESVANKLENNSLKAQFKAQESVLRQYVDKIIESKLKAVSLKEEALKARRIKFKAERLAWKSLMVVRVLIFAIASGFIGAYKAELTQYIIRLFNE